MLRSESVGGVQGFFVGRITALRFCSGDVAQTVDKSPGLSAGSVVSISVCTVNEFLLEFRILEHKLKLNKKYQLHCFSFAKMN